MTEVDELLARLRRMEPIELDRELARSVRDRGRRRLRAGARSSLLASTFVLGTVVAYLGWALHFASALYH